MHEKYSIHQVGYQAPDELFWTLVVTICDNCYANVHLPFMLGHCTGSCRGGHTILVNVYHWFCLPIFFFFFFWNELTLLRLCLLFLYWFFITYTYLSLALKCSGMLSANLLIWQSSTKNAACYFHSSISRAQAAQSQQHWIQRWCNCL